MKVTRTLHADVPPALAGVCKVMGFVRADIWRRFGALGQEPEVLGRIRALSEEPFPEGPESLVDAYLKAQQSQWARVVRERNITVG